ncbi:MAG TPA: hypothetical protein PK286_12315 [Devosia sp.]|nr:hypothetical protein [Devosia sp.]
MRFSILAGALAVLLAPTVALAFDDPRSLVDAIYQPYLNGQQQTDLDQFYSERLKQLFVEQADTGMTVDAYAPGSPAASTAASFNPFIDADHGLLLEVTISEPLIVGNKALVTVGFHNFDQPTLLSLSLVKEGDGWKVDDVTSTGGEANWMLSWLLQYDPWGT